MKGVLVVRWGQWAPWALGEPCGTHVRIDPPRMGSWIISLPEFIKFSAPVRCPVLAESVLLAPERALRQ